MSIWTPTAHGSGFSIGANGLIATSQRVVGNATAIEVQLSPTLKVPANVVGIDAERGVRDPVDRSEGRGRRAAGAHRVRAGARSGGRAEGHHHRIDAAPAEAHDVGHHERARCAPRLLGSHDRAGHRRRSGVLRRRPSRRTDDAPAGGNRRRRASSPGRRPVRADGVCRREAEGRRRAEWRRRCPWNRRSRFRPARSRSAPAASPPVPRRIA